MVVLLSHKSACLTCVVINCLEDLENCDWFVWQYIEETEELAMNSLKQNRHILDMIANELFEKSRITGLVTTLPLYVCLSYSCSGDMISLTGRLYPKLFCSDPTLWIVGHKAKMYGAIIYVLKVKITFEKLHTCYTFLCLGPSGW